MELSCKSFWPHDLQHPTHQIVIISIIAVLTLILNPLLIYSLFKTRQTHTNTFRFIIAMSVSDVLLGAFVMPATAVTISIRVNHKSCVLDQTTHFGFYLFAYFSLFMLMSITFDRLYQLRRLRNSPKSFNQKQLAGLFAFCIITTLFISYFGVAYISFNYQISLVAANCCLIAPLFGSYACLLHKVRIHNIVVAKNLANTNFQGRVSARIETKTSKVVWVLLVALIITYIPFNIITPWLSYVKYVKKEIPDMGLSTATMWAYILIYLHTVVNSLICMTSNSKTRRFIRSKFSKYLAGGEAEVQTMPRANRIEVPLRTCFAKHNF